MSKNHLDEGTLLTLVDGELPSPAAGVAERHLEACGECRLQLDEIRSAAAGFTAALATLDSPAPVVSDATVQAVRRRAREQRRPHGWADLRRAAVLVVGFAAVASATLPGSPVNRWVRGLVQQEERVAAVETAPTATATDAGFVGEAGVSVLPEGGTVRVVLTGVTPALQVRARLTDEPRAGVFANGAAASARFSTAPGRIEVTGATAGELLIELPRAAVGATVEVDGRRYIAKQDDRLRLTIPTAESSGEEVSFRVLQ